MRELRKFIQTDAAVKSITIILLRRRTFSYGLRGRKSADLVLVNLEGAILGLMDRRQLASEEGFLAKVNLVLMLIEFAGSELETGWHKFAVKVTDRFGQVSNGEETGEIIVIRTATPAEGLEVYSYDKTQDKLILNVS
jgi:hypothetical protein